MSCYFGRSISTQTYDRHENTSLTSVDNDVGSAFVNNDIRSDYVGNPMSEKRAKQKRIDMKRSNTIMPEIVAPFRTMHFSDVVVAATRAKTLPMPFVRKKRIDLQSSARRTRLGVGRSKSVLGTPFRHCDACCIKHLRSFEQHSTGTVSHDAMFMDGYTTDLLTQGNDTQPETKGLYLKKPSRVYMLGNSLRPEDTFVSNKGEYSLSLTTTNSRGLIRLGSVQENRSKTSEQSEDRMLESCDLSLPTTLVTRKDMQRQIRLGNIRLEQEKEAEQRRHGYRLEDCTFLDLEAALDHLKNDMKSKRSKMHVTLNPQIMIRDKEENRHGNKDNNGVQTRVSCTLPVLNGK